ncbi:MAG: SUF system Fe-S cluster assembly regulator [Rickettsiales bacterium]|jgi:FeS assembly SUF system regulator|nr:SUF system Fe-S cluster assembly regulator [Rickettsiales bacterium]
MIKVNRLTDYATLIICEMATNKGDIVSAKILSDKTKISETTVIKLLKMLLKKDIIKSHRGTAGGYKLIKELDEISILDVVEAIEGEIALTLCGKNNKNSNNNCEYTNGCKVKHGWNKINSLFMLALQRFTIKDFIDDNTYFQLEKVR